MLQEFQKEVPDGQRGIVEDYYLKGLTVETISAARAFVPCFTAHVRSIRPDLADELIAIDGKTLRHSFDHGDPESSLHLISAWADGCGVTLGQLSVDGKTNEITATPKLLRQIDVKGAAVTLDGSEPAERKHWLGLRSLVEITCTRQIKGQTST